MYNYEDIRMVHLEVTSRCNASCPMCARNIHGGKTSPYLPLTDLRLEQIKQIFPVAFIRQLNKIYLCGNYGDPAAGPETLEILSYFREVHPQITLGVHTNGGVRSSEWWGQLAKVVSYCRFGIDGLEDTNHLYRRNVNWERLQQNIKAFVAAGGRAEWDFLLFEHNEHQIDRARDLAKTWGFQDFQVKNTSRFFDKKTTTTLMDYQVRDVDGQNIYKLRPTRLSHYQNKALEKGYREVVAEYGSVMDYWNKTEIQCRVAVEKSIYISAEGLVFPCCWTAGQLYSATTPMSAANNEVWKQIESLSEGKESLSALRYSIESILRGAYFQKTLPESWNAPSLKEGKLQVCAKTCGQTVKPFESQFIKV